MPEKADLPPTLLASRIAAQFEKLWTVGEPPDPFQFLVEAGACPASVALEVLSLDQWMRWRAGQRLQAEHYLRRRPDLATEPEHALHLVYGEYLVRESLGHLVEPEEYLRRFPHLADRLRQQFESHRAMNADASSHGGTAEGGSDNSSRKINPFATFKDHAGSESEGDAPMPEAEASADALPEKFGRYLIRRVLGKGGMGTVYVAEDTLLGRTVALKVPHFTELGDPALVRRFQLEAQIAATFNHENLCRIYDVGQEDGRCYFTMPLLSGEPLLTQIKREGGVPQHEAVRLTAILARAVQAAHEMGVIHRDLKPSNIMISESRSPIVMDFGLAHRASSQDPRLTIKGTIVGTPSYLPPEQVWGAPEHLGAVGDVYSLGIIFYEMLTGRTPFVGDVHEILRQVIALDPTPPTRLRPALDPRLEAICLTAIAKAPEARFPSMAAFATVLEQYLQSHQPPAVADTKILTRESMPAPLKTDLFPQHSRRKIWRFVPLGLALAAIVSAIVMQFSHTAPVDLFQPGSQWSGTAKFLPPNGHIVDYHIQIISRKGNDFKGKCESEKNQYQWIISGKISNGMINWKYLEVMREAVWTGVVESASVEGKYLGDKLVAFYRDADSAAEIKLTLDK